MAQRWNERATGAGYVPSNGHLTLFHKQVVKPKSGMIVIHAGQDEPGGTNVLYKEGSLFLIGG